MLGFTSAETRKRNAFVENTIDEVAESLASEAVINRLGDMATILAERVDRLYIPNIKDGLVSAPKKYQSTDHIPIIAMYTGEELTVDRSLAAMSPKQQLAVERKIKSWFGESVNMPDEIKAINTDLESRCPQEIVGVDDGTGGFIWSSYAPRRIIKPLSGGVGKSFDRVFQGSSLVGLVPRAEIAQEVRNTHLVHELVHTDQFDENPVTNLKKYKSILYSRELQAYHIGAYYGLGASEIPGGKYFGSGGLNNQWAVENLRAEYARPNEPFYANTQLRAAIHDAGIDIVS